MLLIWLHWELKFWIVISKLCFSIGRLALHKSFCRRKYFLLYAFFMDSSWLLFLPGVPDPEGLPCICGGRFFSPGARVTLQTAPFFSLHCVPFLQLLCSPSFSFQLPPDFLESQVVGFSPSCYFLDVWILGTREAVFCCWFLLCHFSSPLSAFNLFK